MRRAGSRASIVRPMRWSRALCGTCNASSAHSWTAIVPKRYRNCRGGSRRSRRTCSAALFVDYGYPRREFYLPERRDGTLVCHYRHRAHDDPLRYPGLQDITAFVDFTALAEAGDACGFERVGYSPQAAFLIAAGLETAFAESYAATDDEAARYALANQVKRLTLPGEMGERFQMMLFARGLDAPELFAPLMEADRSERL